MLFALLAVFVLAALAPTLHRVLGNASGWVFALAPAGIFISFAEKLLRLPDTGPIVEGIPWIPSLGVELTFLYDGLSLLFVLLISGIGVLILIYAGGYLGAHPQRGRFFCFLLLFMGSMLGVVTAENLIALFVFWELTSLSSYLLIGFNHEQEKSRSSALQALLVTFTGGQAMLAGLILMGMAGGGFSIAGFFDAPDAVRESALYVPILLLLLVGAFTKSAQTPFHFWLPGAMAAPTPVSAYLHSATMVTAGVFLLARLSPVLSGTVLWTGLVTTFGLVTMVVGAVLAVGQTDLKRLLAYTTVSALGTMVMLLGIGTELAAKAAAVFLLVHSLYKGALFMVAGSVDHETGTRDVANLGGLARAMPFTAGAAALAGLAMCGLPPLLGFISKELLYEVQLEVPDWAWLLAGLGVAANALIIGVAGTVAAAPFYGRRKHTPKHAHEAPFSMWLGPAVLAILGLLFGLFPGWIEMSVIGAAASAVLGQPVAFYLELWHGFTPMLALSALTVALGVAVYLLRGRWQNLRLRLAPLNRFGPESGYDASLEGMVRLANWQTRFLQHGYLRYYVLTVVAIATASILLGLTRVESGRSLLHFTDVRIYEVFIALTIFAAGIGAILVRGRLVSVVLIGAIGYCIALIFALYGAPDLALTQFLVETLTLIMLVLVLYHLPKFQVLSSTRSRIRDAVLCGALGVAVTLMLLQAMSLPRSMEIPEYFMANSLVAEGRNVVNVILVDFRALDTLGEIVVLALAGIGVYALLKLKRGHHAKPKEED